MLFLLFFFLAAFFFRAAMANGSYTLRRSDVDVFAELAALLVARLAGAGEELGSALGIARRALALELGHAQVRAAVHRAELAGALELARRFREILLGAGALRI